jgi:hypothetical protein
MISRRLLQLSLILTFLLISSAAWAQTPEASPQTKDEQRKIQKELQGKALGLLEDMIKDVDSFKHPENRIRFRMASANILWTHDEARARLLFREAMAILVDLASNQDAGDDPETFKANESVRALQRELVQMLAMRDPRLAREFLRATRPKSDEQARTRDASPDQQIEMSLAMQIAASDPKQALEIAEETLSEGLSYELPQVISTIYSKDPEGGAKLASQVMSKIRSERLDLNQAARQVAISLLREATQAPENEGAGAKTSPPLLDQATIRELVEMLSKEALRSSSTSPELLGSLGEMMPVIEKYAPVRAREIRRRIEPQKTTTVTEASTGSTDTVIVENRYESMLQHASVTTLLAEAPTAPEEMRGILYQHAIEKLIATGEMDQARQVVNEHVKDPAQRKQLLAQIDEATSLKAAEQGKLEQVRKMLAALRTNEERVTLLTQFASGAAARGDKKAALQLLDEARGMLPGRAKNFSQLGVQLAVARAYAPLDATRSLAILEPVVDQLNELIAAAVVLGGFITDDIIKDDEIMMEPLAMISTHVFVSYTGDVFALASRDFDRTKALVDRFHRDEIRNLARLLLAQSILAPQPDVAVIDSVTLKP